MRNFFKALIVSLAMLVGCGGLNYDQVHGVNSPSLGDQPTASEVYKAQWHIINLMAKDYPRAGETQIMWEPCNEENSAYDPDENKIHLCTEMSEHPSAALMFAAHEMGHAITTAYFSTHSEQEADELGMIEMLKHGYADDLQEAARYYSAQEVQGHFIGDPHPPNSFRAEEAMCLVDGYDAATTNPILHDPKCIALYNGVVNRFQMMFANAKDATPEEELDLLFKQIAKTLPSE